MIRMIKFVPTLESYMAELVTDLAGGLISIVLLLVRTIFLRELTTTIIIREVTPSTTLTNNARCASPTIVAIGRKIEINRGLKRGIKILLLVKCTIFMYEQQLVQFLRRNMFSPCNNRDDKSLI